MISRHSWWKKKEVATMAKKGDEEVKRRSAEKRASNCRSPKMEMTVRVR